MPLEKMQHGMLVHGLLGNTDRAGEHGEEVGFDAWAGKAVGMKAARYCSVLVCEKSEWV